MVDEAAAIRVREVMRTDVPTVRPDQPLIDAARTLLSSGVSSLPVLDEARTLVGIVSEYDVLTKRGATVGDAMSRGVISVGPHETAANAAGLMGAHGVRVLPVVADGHLVGIVTRADLVRVYTETSWLCGACGERTHGLSRPEACGRCTGNGFTLERRG